MQLVTLNVPWSFKMPPPNPGDSVTSPLAIVSSLSVTLAPGPTCRIREGGAKTALDGSALPLDDELVAAVGADHRQTVGAVREVVHGIQAISAIGRQLDRVILAVSVGEVIASLSAVTSPSGIMKVAAKAQSHKKPVVKAAMTANAIFECMIGGW